MHDFEVRHSQTLYGGAPFQLARDTVSMPGGGDADRVYLRHPGAVAVVPLTDDGRVGLIHQYRHPVRNRMWELPAGLRDVDGEDPAVTAGRELIEETDTQAGRIEHLITIDPSPGCSNERIEIYVATDLSPVDGARRHQRSDEEADMTLRWWPLKEAWRAVGDGEITNGATVAGLLAVARFDPHAASLRFSG